MNYKAFLNTVTSKAYCMPVVILYVTEGCNLKCLSCSYRLPMPGELTFEEIKDLAGKLSSFGLKHIVYSGGEPLLRRDFRDVCGVFSGLKVKQTLLTNGLLLPKRAEEFKDVFNEIIVSIDGADTQTHNRLRGVNSFDIILEGIKKVIQIGASPQISIRTVLQKQNFRQLQEFIELAKHTGVNRISFLAADVSSEAYGRDHNSVRGEVSSESTMALNENEVMELKEIINQAALKYKDEFQSGLISESPEKLHHIANYYSALNGNDTFPENFCNAPMVSAVITSTGDIHPCFFLPKYGNIRENTFNELINSDSITGTRKLVKFMEPERCKKCVCTLFITSRNALKGKF
ncbi:MAG: radical SAM protein [Ignavibacteria bacterium]